MKQRLILSASIILFFGSFAQSSYASGVAMLITDSDYDEKIKIEYLNENTVRMQLNTKDSRQAGESYSLLKDSKLYTVANTEEGVRVIDMSNPLIGRMRSSMADEVTANTPEILSLVNTGEKTTVAGYEGDVYEFTFKDKRGTRTVPAVLSSNKKVREFSSAYTAYTETMMNRVAGKLDSKKHSIKYYLDRENKGALSIGNFFTVTSLQTGGVDSSRFSLPAAPMDMPSFDIPVGAMTDSAETEGAQKSGLLGAIFGKTKEKSDRQKNRVDSKADNKVDRVTDKAVDKVFDKIFGK